MKILDRNELNGLLAQGRTAPEHAITEMLDELEKKHPTAYRVIYGEPSDAIASINREMANLYLDLACDEMWVTMWASPALPIPMKPANKRLKVTPIPFRAFAARGA
jgi:hypothetical protein